MRKPSSIFSKVALAVALAAALAAPRPSLAEEARAPAAAPRVVEITAKRFEFTPNAITLEQGVPVTLRVKSADVTHGFFQKELGIDLEVVPGKTAEATITPTKAGAYTIICDHFCGSGHGNMKMSVVVKGAGTGTAATQAAQ